MRCMQVSRCKCVSEMTTGGGGVWRIKTNSIHTKLNKKERRIKLKAKEETKTLCLFITQKKKRRNKLHLKNKKRSRKREKKNKNNCESLIKISWPVDNCLTPNSWIIWIKYFYKQFFGLLTYPPSSQWITIWIIFNLTQMWITIFIN